MLPVLFEKELDPQSFDSTAGIWYFEKGLNRSESYHRLYELNKRLMMIYKLKHFGVIGEAEFEIRPLTVFIGKNNSNKTWTAYGLYGLISLLSRSRLSTTRSLPLQVDHQIQSIIDEFVGEIYAKTADLLRDTEPDVAKQNLTSTLTFSVSKEELFSKLVYPVRFSLSAKGLSTLLGVPDRDLGDAQVELQLDKPEFEKSPLSSMELIYNTERSFIDYYFISNKSRLGPFRTLRRSLSSQQSDNALKGIIENAFRHFFLSCFNFAGAFPAERKALVSNYFLDSYRYVSPTSIVRTAPLPIKDFIEMIYRAELIQDRAREGSDFVNLAEVLEQRILKGKIGFQSADDDQPAEGTTPKRVQRGRLNFSPSDDVDLKMHASASIVRSLAGLDIYLRTFCSSGDFVVIDEPEMNAHPEAQLIMMELLASLANKGVNVVITTHSPYLTDHLNNLIEASKLSQVRQREIVSAFKLNDVSSFIIQDRVSTYYFSENGHIKDVFDRSNGLIDLSSFSDESNYVTNLFSKILEVGRDEGCDFGVESSDGE